MLYSANASRKQITGLLFFLVITFAAAAAGSAATSTSVSDWYQTIAKPAWTPPSWIFGPVWTLLFLLMAIAAWLVWRKAGTRRRPAAIALFHPARAQHALVCPVLRPATARLGRSRNRDFMAGHRRHTNRLLAKRANRRNDVSALFGVGHVRGRPELRHCFAECVEDSSVQLHLSSLSICSAPHISPLTSAHAAQPTIEPANGSGSVNKSATPIAKKITLTFQRRRRTWPDTTTGQRTNCQPRLSIGKTQAR